eukprot:Gb_31393 [translate_table: standard]
MAKKRKSENAGLDEAERTMYTSFSNAANSLSQLYTQAQHQQKLAFQAGERHALVRLSGMEWENKLTVCMTRWRNCHSVSRQLEGPNTNNKTVLGSQSPAKPGLSCFPFLVDYYFQLVITILNPTAIVLARTTDCPWVCPKCIYAINYWCLRFLAWGTILFLGSDCRCGNVCGIRVRSMPFCCMSKCNLSKTESSTMFWVACYYAIIKFDQYYAVRLCFM